MSPISRVSRSTCRFNRAMVSRCRSGFVPWPAPSWRMSSSSVAFSGVSGVRSSWLAMDRNWSRMAMASRNSFCVRSMRAAISLKPRVSWAISSSPRAGTRCSTDGVPSTAKPSRRRSNRCATSRPVHCDSRSAMAPASTAMATTHAPMRVTGANASRSCAVTTTVQGVPLTCACATTIRRPVIEASRSPSCRVADPTRSSTGARESTSPRSRLAGGCHRGGRTAPRGSRARRAWAATPTVAGTARPPGRCAGLRPQLHGHGEDDVRLAPNG